jgi:hypothetical protein
MPNKKGMKNLIKQFSKGTVFVVIFIAVCLGCEKDLYMKMGEGGGNLVLFSFLTADSVFSVHLSRSVNYASVDDFERVYDGYVAVRKNGVLVDSFAYPFRDLWAFRPEISIEEGAVFDISAGDSEGNRISGRTVIPSFIPIENLDTLRRISVDSDGVSRTYLECLVRFNDPVDTENFYQLVVIEESWDKNGNGYSSQRVNYLKDDPVFYIRDQEGSLLGGIDFLGTFPDFLINGQNYSLKIRLPEVYAGPATANQKRKLTFLLVSHSFDYFNYLRSRVVAEYNYDLPIVDPIKIHSNIIGGLGLVGGMSVVSDSLIFIGNAYE